MNIYYRIKEDFLTELDSYPNINSVTYGDITDVDLDKTENYSLAHFIVNSMSLRNRTSLVNMSVIFMDVVDDAEDNTDDVINTMVALASRLKESLRGGSLYVNDYVLEGDVDLEIFVDRFKDKVAGVTATFSFIAPNLIAKC